MFKKRTEQINWFQAKIQEFQLLKICAFKKMNLISTYFWINKYAPPRSIISLNWVSSKTAKFNSFNGPGALFFNLKKSLYFQFKTWSLDFQNKTFRRWSWTQKHNDWILFSPSLRKENISKFWSFENPWILAWNQKIKVSKIILIHQEEDQANFWISKER